jgi:hypothetical protein
MSFAQVDGDKLSSAAQGMLGDLATELRTTLKKEEPAPTSNGGTIEVDVVESRSRAGGVPGE